MDENLKIIEYIRETAEVIHSGKNGTVTAEQMLEQFLFPRSKQWTYIHRLSGGEKRRLYLLKILMEEPNVLLLDEPTNDLDTRSEEHTSELQSRGHLVCRLLLETK